MIEKNAQIISTSNQSFKASALFSLVMGAAFVLFGVSQYSSVSGFLPYFLMVLGSLFLINGLLRLRRSARFPVDHPDETTKNG